MGRRLSSLYFFLSLVLQSLASTRSRNPGVACLCHELKSSGTQGNSHTGGICLPPHGQRIILAETVLSGVWNPPPIGTQFDTVRSILCANKVCRPGGDILTSCRSYGTGDEPHMQTWAPTQGGIRHRDSSSSSCGWQYAACTIMHCAVVHGIECTARAFSIGDGGIRRSLRGAPRHRT